jgi:hypothetical protein
VRTVHEIGPFRLDADAGVLTRAGLPVALGARGVAVLALVSLVGVGGIGKTRLALQVASEVR